jgi:hypothetical protein
MYDGGIKREHSLEKHRQRRPLASKSIEVQGSKGLFILPRFAIAKGKVSNGLVFLPDSPKEAKQIPC